MGRNISVANGKTFISRFSLYPFGSYTTRGDRRPTPKCQKLRIDNNSCGIELKLYLHYVTTCRRPDQTRAYVWVLPIHLPDISRIFVVIYHNRMITSSHAIM